MESIGIDVQSLIARVSELSLAPWLKSDIAPLLTATALRSRRRSGGFVRRSRPSRFLEKQGVLRGGQGHGNA
jgi:hypothetical protein